MTAEELMAEAMTNDYPVAIKRQIWRQVRDLLAEGQSETIIMVALKDWETRPGVSPALLPHLVSDAIRVRPPQTSNWEEKLREEMGC